MNSTWTCAINHGSDQAWAIPVWQLLTPRVYTKHACAVTGATPAPTTTSPYLSKNGLAPLPPPPPPPSLLLLYPCVTCIATLTFPHRTASGKTFWSGFETFFFFSLTVHASVSAADPHADGEICHPLSLDELFLLHMAAALIPGCLRIFQDTTSTDFF